ncbi:3-methyl-2-oxobutanoate hydroxymethyltransferase [bacterium]|nr:3-methyl-2-oxobutanoate hydroxymethyltransferase [bacterium]
MPRKFTVPKIQELKDKGEKISVLTAYDFITAKLLDEVGIEMILVGDSLGMVFGGEITTLKVTFEEMLYHCKIVSKATENALVIGDMPFLTYHTTEKALENCGNLVKNAGVHAVKLEGGKWLTETIERLVEIGIPVIGHLGLTPQSINKFGSYGLRAKNEAEAQKLKEDALALQEAGVFAIVLEKIPSKLAKEVTESLKIPTIGIGAGNFCSGQVLVTQDILGLFDEFHPKFVRRYAEIGKEIKRAVSQFRNEVKTGDFPNKDESY